MIIATVTGNVGKTAEVRQVGSSSVCNFTVASNKTVKGEKRTTWVQCALWGSRGEKLAPHITKGKSVAVGGELSTREHDGKTYVEMDVAAFDFTGSKSDGQRSGAGTHREASAPTGGGGFDDADYGGQDDSAILF